MTRGSARCHNKETVISEMIPCFGYILRGHFAAARRGPGTMVDPEMRRGIQAETEQVVRILPLSMLSGSLLETSVKDPDCLRTSDPAQLSGCWRLIAGFSFRQSSSRLRRFSLTNCASLARSNAFPTTPSGWYLHLSGYRRQMAVPRERNSLGLRILDKGPGVRGRFPAR